MWSLVRVAHFGAESISHCWPPLVHAHVNIISNLLRTKCESNVNTGCSDVIAITALRKAATPPHLVTIERLHQLQQGGAVAALQDHFISLRVLELGRVQSRKVFAPASHYLNSVYITNYVTCHLSCQGPVLSLDVSYHVYEKLLEW